MKVPTMKKMLKVYLVSATVERIKCGRPNERTVRNTRGGYRIFMRWMEARHARLGTADQTLCDIDDLPVSIIKPALVHAYLADLLKSGIKPITAISYIYQLRQLFAKWVLPYYEDHGWKVPPFPSFGHRPKAPRYKRPAAATLAKVKAWYFSLPPGVLWFVATMMLEFAMRNGDILRLRRSNFVAREGRVFLNYTPHKTEHSSGRVVKWPVHPLIWEQMTLIFKGDDLPEIDEQVFDELNVVMRGFGFTGTKGAYELRKICVDHVYQRFGAEMAVSISGDDVRTIMYYYADPAQPNIDNIRVTDLIRVM